ncbi:response regulator transcription factor [Terasakiella sp. SH-1]|uniref:response regulator transcription factor n=1 Tax=Terasakiella sp. SH-1 TaxID=2560057 RepID=UPI0010735885|nr:response regulator transcription factor [Terasakiella sp. SH-1]
MDKLDLIFLDDDDDFLIPVSRMLEKNDISVRQARTFSDLNSFLAEDIPDLLILDITLPDGCGLDILQQLNKDRTYPVILLTAKGEVEDRVIGLNLGADYYLPKPVNIKELIAVIHNLVRKDKNIQDASWVFDLTKWTLTSPDNETCDLTAAEYNILSILSEKSGSPVEREDLYKGIGRKILDFDDRSLDMIISRLRRKFTPQTKAPPIKSVRGKGYVFVKPITVIGEKLHNI